LVFPFPLYPASDYIGGWVLEHRYQRLSSEKIK
jgi:hypothetical protein